ncbi:MAG: hypothetical protein IJT32_02020, partial [Lachnospiraceae bacterium]|nr:hypothetical protein [Lachnospiraceae bacterium]
MAKTKLNVVKFKRPIHVNIGIIICGIIFVYVLFHLLSYYTTKNISIYEVKSGSLVSDHQYRAFAIRQEEIVSCDKNGYIYYFTPDRSRVGVRSQIYCIDETGSIIASLTSEDKENTTQLSEDALSTTENTIASFSNSFSNAEFQKTYSFKDNLTDELRALYVDTVMKQHADQIASALSADTYHIYYAAHPGLVSYVIDGFEGTTKKNFTGEVFDEAGDGRNLKGRTQVSSGDEVYKLITSDNWSMVIPADEELLKQIKDKNVLQVTFEQDKTTAWGNISLLEDGGKKFLVMDFDDSMERYADQRFININLNLNEEKGLKIPNSAIVKKTFFTIPKGYFLKGSDSSDLGLLLKKEGGETTFVTPTIYYETDDYYYIDNEKFHKGDVIVKGDSADTYTIG